MSILVPSRLAWGRSAEEMYEERFFLAVSQETVQSTRELFKKPLRTENSVFKGFFYVANDKNACYTDIIKYVLCSSNSIFFLSEGECHLYFHRPHQSPFQRKTISIRRNAYGR